MESALQYTLQLAGFVIFLRFERTDKSTYLVATPAQRTTSQPQRGRSACCGDSRLPRNGVRVPEADLNEAALRRTLARDTIWQGNCDLCGQQLRSNIASVRNTIPIQYPYKQLPCQKKLPSSRCIESAPCSSVSHSSTPFQTARFRYSTKTLGESGVALLQVGLSPEQWKWVRGVVVNRRQWAEGGKQ